MGTAWTFAWTPAAIERLRVLWFDGYSAREIGRAFGVTRNSIIGRVHRSGWTGMERVRRLEASKGYRLPPIVFLPPPEPEKPQKKLRKPLEVRLHRRKVERPKLDPPIGSFTLMGLKHGSCRWPEGDAAPFTYCGAQREEGSSYCPEHHQRAHQRGSQSVLERTFEPTRSSSKLYRFGKMAA